MLGLRFCVRAFSSCGKWGPLLIAVLRPLTVAASLVVEHRLQTRRLSNCGSRAQLLRGMWDPPRPGLEPVSPALAGRLPTTVPPGKPQHYFFDWGGMRNRFYSRVCLVSQELSSNSQTGSWNWVTIAIFFPLEINLTVTKELNEEGNF